MCSLVSEMKKSVLFFNTRTIFMRYNSVHDLVSFGFIVRFEYDFKCTF